MVAVARGHILNRRYQLLYLIGGGGMAQVYLARDLALDRPVAVKVLSERYTGDPRCVERFRREAQAAARLSPPTSPPCMMWAP
jgi:eukaryotic-like serine/threonine-protein kinase